MKIFSTNKEVGDKLKIPHMAVPHIARLMGIPRIGQEYLWRDKDITKLQEFIISCRGDKISEL